MNLKEIQELIRFVSKSGVSEVQLEQKDFKIVIKAELLQQNVPQYAPAPQQMPQVIHTNVPQQTASSAATEAPKAATAQSGTTSAEEINYEIIRSPMIGTFYRKSSPDKDAFVKIGDSVSKGQTVCVIEAMKLFNEIESDISGKIVKVLVEDQSPVEYDQPLFLVEPA